MKMLAAAACLSAVLLASACSPAAALASLPSCSASFATPNYASNNDPGTGRANLLLRWASFPLRYFIAAAQSRTFGSTTYSSRTIMKEALQRWTTASGNQATFIEVGTEGEADIILRAEQISAAPGPLGTLGTTQVEYYSSNRQIIRATVRINTWPGMTQAQFTQGFKGTSTHELGHALFLLGHSPASADLMYPTSDPSLDDTIRSRDTNTFLTSYCGDFGRSRKPMASPLAGERPSVLTIECPADAHGH
jgi:predicted Zn-dependent protease